MRLTYTMLLATIMLLGCQPGKKSASADAGMDASPHFIEGQCGVEGLLVECNVESDCLRFGPKVNHCTLFGWCVHDMPGIYRCFIDSPGEPCLYEDKVCGDNGFCTYPCTTHDDCPETQYCACTGDGSYCGWRRCWEGGCLDGSYPFPGTLVCAPNSHDGDCFGPNNTCPEGHSKLAENVGPDLLSAACVADATSL